jgi:hypothetical protein
MGRMKEILYRTSGEERYDRSGDESTEARTEAGKRPVDVNDNDHSEAIRRREAK